MRRRHPSAHRLLNRVIAAAAVGGSAAVAALLGCVTGGANSGQQQPGNGDFGVAVQYGDIAIDPRGQYFLYRADEGLALGDLASRESRVLAGIDRPVRLAFGADGRTLFLTVGSEGEGELMAYDVVSEQVRWRRSITLTDSLTSEVTGSYPLLQVSEDGSKLAVTSPGHLDVVDPADGGVTHRVDFTTGVADVDLVGNDRAVVTLDESWTDDAPTTQVTSIDLTSGTTQTVDVPNCAANLVVDAASNTAYLAPTVCTRDPVSVIDLATMTWERNLPGFGPVVLAPGGGTVIAFADAEQYDPTLAPEGPLPQGDLRYHIMLIDAASRGFELVPYGEVLPRYTLTPDGAVLLIDAASAAGDGRIRMLDVQSRQISETTGPDVRLDHFAMTRDGQRVYMLRAGLFHLVVGAGVIEPIELAFTPENLNLTPDEAALLLREDDETIRVYDLRRPPEIGVELPVIDLEVDPLDLPGPDLGG